MASVLFTALALIAAGQAQVPAAPAAGGQVQGARAAHVAVPEAGPRVRNRERR